MCIQNQLRNPFDQNYSSCKVLIFLLVKGYSAFDLRVEPRCL